MIVTLRRRRALETYDAALRELLQRRGSKSSVEEVDVQITIEVDPEGVNDCVLNVMRLEIATWGGHLL